MISRWFDNLRFQLYHLYLCWKERDRWQSFTVETYMKDSKTKQMTIWEIFKDGNIQVCPIYPHHLSGNPYGCYECQCKAHDAGWYDMDTGYLTR